MPEHDEARKRTAAFCETPPLKIGAANPVLFISRVPVDIRDYYVRSECAKVRVKNVHVIWSTMFTRFVFVSLKLHAAPW